MRGSPPEKSDKSDKTDLPSRQKAESSTIEKSQTVASGKKPGIDLSFKTVFGSRENRSVESNLPLSNTASQTPLPEKAAGTSATESVLARDLFKQIAVALGVPSDSLSVTLIAFLRFFSISPDPALLKTLRREALASLKTSSPATAKEKAALEAKALALVSALDKGVELSKEALERYVRYLEPLVFTENEEGTAEAGQKDDFLDILNSLPGKNRKHWIIFPFNIDIRGTVLKVFLRLLKREPLCPGETEYAIVDIAGPKRQWRCCLERKDKKLRADIQIYPGMAAGALKILSREAELFLGKADAGTHESGGFEEIRVRNGEEMPSWMEDLCNEYVPSVDEEV